MYQQLFIPHTLLCQIGNNKNASAWHIQYYLRWELSIYDHFTGTNCKSKHNIFTN